MHTCLLNYRKINMQNACAERHAKTSSEEQKAKHILPKVKIVQHALFRWHFHGRGLQSLHWWLLDLAGLK